MNNLGYLFNNLGNLEIVTDQNYLQTIFLNFTGNAIKALSNSTELNKTKNGQITWKAYCQNNQTYWAITENGAGVFQVNLKTLHDDTEAVCIKTGLGLHQIRDLAKAIDCEISVDSQVGIGTTFILKLK